MSEFIPAQFPPRPPAQAGLPSLESLQAAFQPDRRASPPKRRKVLTGQPPASASAPTSEATSKSDFDGPDKDRNRSSDKADNIDVSTPPAGTAPDEDPDHDALDDIALSRKALRDVLTSAGAPAAAKAQAARTLLELSGELKNAKPPADPAKPITDMTRSELEAELARISAGLPQIAALKEV